MFQFYTKTNQKKPLSIKKDSDLDYSLWEREESMNWGGGGPRRWGGDSSILDQVLSNVCMHTYRHAHTDTYSNNSHSSSYK